MSEFNNLVQSDEIKLLEFPENVRNRIGMYLGGTDNTDQLLNEIVSNSIDESYVSADVIVIDRDMNGFNCVADNGRGIRIDYSDIIRDGKPVIQADLSISELHSGSKFMDNKNATVGQFGIGSSAVNAVSENYILMSRITPLNYDKSIKEVYDLWQNSGPRSKKDLFYIVWYKKGYKYFEGALKKSDIEKMVFSGGKKKATYKELPTGMSTIVLYQPDPEIFEEKALKANLPIQNLKYFLLIQEKFYKKKVTIDLEGTTITSADFDKYQFEFTKRIIPEDTSSNEFVDLYVTFEVDPTLNSKTYTGSVNSLSVDSGVHLTYLENCFAEAIKSEYGIKHKYLTNGLKLCVVVLASETIFNSQIKEKLKSITKVKPTDFAPVVKEFQKIFRKNSDYWAEYVRKLNYYADSMKHLGAAEKAQKIMDDAAGRGVYRGKSEMVDGFSDATAGPGERWDCEIFCTEGLSPAGALKAARKSTKYTAVLPLRGRVKNVVNDSASQMMNNKELFTMFKAIGLGIDVNNVTSDCQTPEEAYEKIKQRTRFGKLVIATDADEDGLAIQNGLLYAISKFARFMLDFHLVYVCESPIFEQDGQYFYPSDQRVPGTQFPVGLNTSRHFRRFKGLGSLNQDDVYNAFYDKTKRRLFVVTTDGIDFSMKMVEEIDARKEFLYDKNILSNPYNFKDL